MVASTSFLGALIKLFDWGFKNSTLYGWLLGSGLGAGFLSFRLRFIFID